MKKIYGYQLKADTIILYRGEQTLALPKGSEIQSVIGRRDSIILYAIVPENVPERETWNIQVLGTGDNLVTHNHKFLGTISMLNGDYIWHVYYKKD